jgi:hypothetical protein
MIMEFIKLENFMIEKHLQFIYGSINKKVNCLALEKKVFINPRKIIANVTVYLHFLVYLGYFPRIFTKYKLLEKEEKNNGTTTISIK